MCARSAPRARVQAGFSLVELMVGLVVALLIGITVAGTAQFVTASQRQSMGLASAQSATSLSLAALKQELGLGGLGLYHGGAPLCPGLQASSAAVEWSRAVFSPVDVTYVDGQPVVDIFYADSLLAAAPALVAAPALTSAPSLELASFLPAKAGDAVVLAPADGTSAPCALRTVTSVAAATELDGQVLFFDAAGAHNQVALLPASSLTAKSAVALLGRLTHTRFRVQAGELIMERPLDGTRAVLARNVVGFDVRYGVVDALGQGLESWVAPRDGWSPLGAQQGLRVRLVQVGVVVRADQREKPRADGTCEASSQQPELLGQPLALSGDWQCYRYRSATLVAPLRNFIIGAQT